MFEVKVSGKISFKLQVSKTESSEGFDFQDQVFSRFFKMFKMSFEEK